MNTFLRTALVLLFSAFAWGCGDDDAAAQPSTTGGSGTGGDGEGGSGVGGDGTGGESTGDYALEVEGGFGSGTYAAGARVHIWADLRPQDQILTSWQGDADVLERPTEWHTVVTMPSHDVNVQAVVEGADFEVVVAQFSGSTSLPKTVRAYFPNNPRGLVLMNHGTGGDSKYFDKLETHYLAMVAVQRGYAVLATEAEEVVAGDLDGNGKIRWDGNLTIDNTDFANLDQLVASLRADGTIDFDTPLFAVGMSNGGSFSISLGAVASQPAGAAAFPELRFAATVSFCASGNVGSSATETPTAWHLCEADDNENVSNDKAVANYESVGARGVPTSLAMNPPSPLYDARFTRIGGVAAAESASVAEELRAAGFVGDGGLITTSADEIGQAATADPGAFTALLGLEPAQLSELRNQVRVMRAAHAMYSDLAAATLDFLDEHNPG